MKNRNIREIRFFFVGLLIVFSLVSGILKAQPNLEWAKHTAGESNDAGHSVVVDKDSNVYVLGKFSGVADFDPGPGMHVIQSECYNSMFVSKYGSSGNLIWVKTIQATGAASIYLDDSSNIYTTGTFFHTVDFDPGVGIQNLTSAGSISNIFVCKWDSAGNYLWANKVISAYQSIIAIGTTIKTDDSCNVYITGSLGGLAFVAKFSNTGTFLWDKRFANYIESNSIFIDFSGNILVAGYTSSTGNIDFDPGLGTYFLNSLNGKMFICKLDKDGNFILATNFGGTSNIAHASSIICDSDNEIYISGTFDDTSDFDPGPGIQNLISISSSFDGSPFVAKYDSLGNYIWANSIQGEGKSSGLTFDSNENLILTGYSVWGVVDFDPGPGVFNLTPVSGSEVFVCKFNNSGNFIWAGLIGGFRSFVITADSNSNIFVTGYINAIADFDPSSGILNLACEGISNVFICKLDSFGSLVWANSVVGSSITHNEPGVDANGNFYVSGGFEGNVDFDPDSGVVFANYSGNKDVFIRKLNSSGNLEWVKSFGGPSLDYGLFGKSDNAGNVYVAGFFSDTVDFDPGSGVFNLIGNSFGDKSYFISSLDASGNFRWAKKLEVNYYNYQFIVDIEVDGSGNIFITGGFRDTIDFDPGPGTHFLTANPYDDNFYVLKLNDAGEFLWAHAFGDIWNTTITSSVAIDGLGNSYYSGLFNSTFDFDPGPGIFNMTATDNDHVFLLKLDAGGNFVWAEKLGGFIGHDGYVYPTFLFSGIEGQLYVSSGFSGTVDFDPGSGLDTVTSTFNNTMDMFVVKYGASGNLIWKKIFPALNWSDHITGTSLTVNNSGHVVVVGSKIDFPGYLEIIEMDSTGNLILLDNQIWENETGFVLSDQFDNLILTNLFTNTTDFDVTNGVYELSPSGASDIAISKYGSTNTSCSTMPTTIYSNAINNTICSGQPVSLTQYGGVLNPGGSFQWFTDSCGGAPVGNGSSITFTPNDTITYFVRAEDTCGVTACDSIVINVIPSPSIPVITGNNNFCPGTSIILDAGSGFNGYSWSTGSVAQTTPVSVGGDYIVTVTSANGCSSMASVTVIPFPRPPVFIMAASNLEMCLGDTVHLDATISAGYSYQWYMNSNAISGATNSYYDAWSGGKYTCQVTDWNSCDSTSNPLKVKIICMPPFDPEQSKSGSINDDNDRASLNVHYNSSHSLAIVSCHNFRGEKYVLQVTDVNGKIIYHSSGSMTTPEFVAEINYATFAPNIYLVTIRTEMEFLTSRFVKE